MESGIYRIKVGRRYYIGRTNNLARRNSRHRRDLEKGQHHNPILQNSYNKNKDYEFTVLGICSLEDLEAFEQHFLDNTNNCNLKDASRGFEYGNKVNLGRKHSKEHKKKNSLAKGGRRNPSYNPNVFRFEHPELGSEKLTSFDMRVKYGIGQSHMSNLVRGKRKTAKGWSICQN